MSVLDILILPFSCSDTTEIVITGLKPFSTYEFSVRAHESEKTYGPFSHPVQAMTMGNRKYYILFSKYMMNAGLFFCFFVFSSRHKS